jgi:hypothetical protein
MAVGVLLNHIPGLWELVGSYAGSDIRLLDKTLEDRDKSAGFTPLVVGYEGYRNLRIFWSALLNADIIHGDLYPPYPGLQDRDRCKLSVQLKKMVEHGVPQVQSLLQDTALMNPGYGKDVPPCDAETDKKIRALLNDEELQNLLFDCVDELWYVNWYDTRELERHSYPTLVVNELALCRNIRILHFSNTQSHNGTLNLTCFLRLERVTITGSGFTKAGLIIAHPITVLTDAHPYHGERILPPELPKQEAAKLPNQENSKACVLL